MQRGPVLGAALVAAQEVDRQGLVAMAYPIDQIGVGGAQIGADVGVFGNLQGSEIDLGEQFGRQMVSQEVPGDLTAAEAFAQEGVGGVAISYMA